MHRPLTLGNLLTRMQGLPERTRIVFESPYNTIPVHVDYIKNFNEDPVIVITVPEELSDAS